MAESSNKTLFKPLLPKGLFVFLTAVMVFAGFWSIPSFAKASFFSGVLDFIKGSDANASAKGLNNAGDSFSMPLLGSNRALPLGVGGLVTDDNQLPLSSTQDNALVGLRNPLGTLPSSSRDQIVVYTVAEGDTLTQIGERFGVSVNTLLWANNIKNPRAVKVGDQLVVLPVSGVQYEIKKGDTIESIAKKFRGDAADILSFNGLAINEILQPGSTIIIPDGEVIPVPGIQRESPVSRFAGLPEFIGYYLRPILGGRKSIGFHGFNGVDLANSCSLPVLASAQGNVILARDSGWNGGYGKYVVISHPNSTQTLYAHLSKAFADPGQAVSQGAIIGLIGSTGNSTGCHVHFEVRGAKNPF